MSSLSVSLHTAEFAQEEESALPLIRHYFTRQEMEGLVGKIMGKRPTELMEVRHSVLWGPLFRQPIVPIFLASLALMDQQVL